MTAQKAGRGPRQKTAAFLSSGSTRKGTPSLYAYGSSKTAGRNVSASAKPLPRRYSTRQHVLYHAIALPVALAFALLACGLVWAWFLLLAALVAVVPS